MTIEVKSPFILQMLMSRTYHPDLLKLVTEIEREFGIVFITSAYRPDDPGVHGTDPCRGLDIRSWVYKEPEIVVKWITNKTIYDPTRKHMVCAMLHDIGRGPHIHLQVHPNTTMTF